jgi:hypothetical protein
VVGGERAVSRSVGKMACKIFLLREITYAPRRPHDGRCEDGVT